MANRIKALANKCSGCGCDMVFNADSQCVTCPSCNKSKAIKSLSSIQKHDVAKKVELTDKNTSWATQAKNMACPNCGAKVLLNNYQASSKCPYCTTDLIASIDDFNGLKPDAIIPFAFGKEKAATIFKDKLDTKAFISKKIKNAINTNEICGYYFPVFMFDAEASTMYHGRLYENYTVKDRDGNSETKRKYFDISGHKITKHENIEIEASSKINQMQLSLIKPFNKNQLKPYQDEYVYGYELEYYNNSILDCYSQAQQIMKGEIKQSILFNYKYDGIDSFEMSNNFTSPKYTYAFYPIYCINYSHKGKNYSNIMNGQTGTLQGDYPKSAGKVALALIGGILGFLLIFLIPALFVIFAFL
ncbi:MAG: hypothetical protein IKY10_03150 [Clostridia bacterium]|nr:hypothetical protein [Clostridia bacterium]